MFIKEKVGSSREPTDSFEEAKKETRKYVHNYRLKGFVYCKECGEKFVGKSGKGRGGKYYYYSHKRKMLNQGDRHTQRCILESISAPQLEEAVLAGLKRLKEDQKLLKSLIYENNEGKFKNSSYKDGLIQSVKEKHKAIRSKIEGIISAISEAPKAKSTKILMKKLEELESEKEVLEEEIGSLVQERKMISSNIIDLRSAFSLLRAFNKKFPNLPPRQQREVLKNILRKVVVAREGIYVECYGLAPTQNFHLDSKQKNSIFQENKERELNRSWVRPLSRLVDRPRQQNNLLYYVYFIEFFPKIQAIDSKVFKELYEKKSLSISQIAKQLDVSNHQIRKLLLRSGISTKRSLEKLRNPKNYRLPRVPYGFRRGKNSELLVNQSELKVCRLVVHLKKKGLSLTAIISELQNKGFKNRRGVISWHHTTVKRIFKRWKDKL